MRSSGRDPHTPLMVIGVVPPRCLRRAIPLMFLIGLVCGLILTPVTLARGRSCAPHRRRRLACRFRS